MPPLCSSNLCLSGRENCQTGRHFAASHQRENKVLLDSMLTVANISANATAFPSASIAALDTTAFLSDVILVQAMEKNKVADALTVIPSS